MGNNCCLGGVLDLFLDWSNGDPRVLCHTLSIHPSRSNSGENHNNSARGCIVGGRPDIGREYELGEALGKGQFGVIRRCTHRCSGDILACKSIAKLKLNSAGDIRDVQREIEILRHLSGHPNVVQLKDVFEDEENVHMVMELCDGGELFDRIVRRRCYPESEAAALFKTLIQVIGFCHDEGIIHRDLKPENILFSNGQLKVADFGLAVRFRPGDVQTGMAGSAYYIAPEVLRGEYGEQVDVWSAGVVLYVLLSGVPPFWDETEEGIFDAIRYGHLDLASDPWPQISAAAKDLVRGVLCPDVSKRLTPRQILEHEWIVKHTNVSQPEVPLRVELPAPASVLDLSSSWRSWQTVASVSSSDSSSDDEQEYVNTKQPEQPTKDRDDAGNERLSKWTSLTQVTEPTMNEFLAVLLKKGELDTCKVEHTMLLHTSTPNVIVSTSKGRFLVVHDRERKRIGWKQLHSSSSTPTQEAAILCQDMLLWSPFPTDMQDMQQASSSSSGDSS